MHWAVLVLFSVAAAIAVGLGPAGSDAGGSTADELLERRRLLLSELREIEEDVVAGRTTVQDRAVARRALAPELRSVTAALRALGEEPRDRVTAARSDDASAGERARGE